MSITTKKPIIIIVDGLIGAGKTTTINLLEQALNDQGIKTKAIYEPIDIWQNTGALEHFYQNISQNCYEFQTFTFVTRIQRVNEQIKDDSDIEIYLLERSIFSDRYIFVEMLREQFGKIRMAMYETWWDEWSKLMKVKPDLFILLDTDVEHSMERLESRNRDGETKGGVTSEYQESLRETHLKFYRYKLNEIGYMHPMIVTSESMNKNFLNNFKHPTIQRVKYRIMNCFNYSFTHVIT